MTWGKNGGTYPHDVRPFDVQQQMLTMAFPALQNAYLQKHQECESVATKCEETKAQLTLEKNNLEQSRKECSRLRQEHKEISLQLQTALETNKELNAGMLLAKKTQQTQFNNAQQQRAAAAQIRAK